MADPIFAADTDPRVFDTALRHAPRHCPVDQPPEASTPDVLAPSDQDALLGPGAIPAKVSGPVPKAQPLPQRSQPGSKQQQQQQQQHTAMKARHAAPPEGAPAQPGSGSGVLEAPWPTGGPAPATNPAPSVRGTLAPAPAAALVTRQLLSVTLKVEKGGRIRLCLEQPGGGPLFSTTPVGHQCGAPFSAPRRSVRGITGRDALPGLDAVKADHEELRALFDEYDSLCEPHHERHDQQQLGDAAADHTSTTHTTAAIANTAAIAATPDGSLHARKLALAGRVVRLLSAHASAEERSLYPLARSVLPYGKELYDKSLVDDQVAKEMLQYLLTHRPCTAEGWALYDRVFRGLADHERGHMGMEEDMVLSPLRRALSPDQQLRFSQDWHVSVACAPTRPHPRGPASGPWAQLLQPVVGLADRAADWWAATAFWGRAW